MNIKSLKLLAGAFLLGVILFAAGQFEAGQAAKAAESQDVYGTARYDYAFQVLEIVNKERALEGAGPLTMDKDLLSAAMLRSAETVVSFSHTRPNGEKCFTASSKMSGENIAMGGGSSCATPEQVMIRWMNSPGHKANILTKSYQSIGIGCFVTNYGTYWVQCFGRGTAQTLSQPENEKAAYRVAADTTSQTVMIKGTDVGSSSASMSTASPMPSAAPAEATENPASTKIPAWALNALSQTKDPLQFNAKCYLKKIKLKWNKLADVSGYEIQISNKRNFKQKQIYSLKKSKTQKVIKKYKGKKLELGKAYYVRIRTFKNNDGTRVYGSWSNRIRCQM